MMDPKSLIDSLEISDEKRKWIEQYALNHIEAEKNPLPEATLLPPRSLDHFEIHPVMKEMWKTGKLSEDLTKSHMVELFDFVKLSFTANDKKWSELNTADKSRNFFMMNRFLSIKFPLQVSVLSHMRINAPATMDYWHMTLRKLFQSVPPWIYAKTKKKSVEDKKKNLPTEQMVRWYCQKEEISRKDYEDSIKMFGDEFLNEIRDLEKVLKSQGLLKAD